MMSPPNSTSDLGRLSWKSVKRCAEHLRSAVLCTASGAQRTMYINIGLSARWGRMMLRHTVKVVAGTRAQAETALKSLKNRLLFRAVANRRNSPPE